MVYDALKDPTRSPYPNRTRSQKFGRAGAQVAVAGATALNPYTRIVCLTTGNVSVLPVENADGVYVTFTGVAAGFIPPYEVREINGAGTTCSVASIDYGALE